MRLEKIDALDNKYLESIGFTWHTDSDESSYIANELVVISEEEAEAFYEATNELYDMFIEGAQYVIDNELFHELNIPFNLVEVIKESWENDVHWHLYSRFDLAGGVDGKPIKLIEFNADTPTSLFETAIIQWAMLKKNGLDESSQFNNLYDALKENFKRIITLDSDIEKFDEYYSKLGWKILFSSISSSSEDINTTKLLQHIASEAGFNTDFEFIENVNFSDDGIFKDDELFEFWFKLIPWEDIAIQESELALILTEIIKEKRAIIFNPAYTLIFQSKAFMKILWDLYPNHPLLLETSFEPLVGKKYVEKKAFGREGANVKIINSDGSVEIENGGEYEGHKSIFQEYVDFIKDSKGECYQAGVFYAYEACGLGFRRGGKILNNMSKFVGHIIK
ncbi:glutathionylspermidine synthase family protein [Aliarcobacter skirrowii]|uniref:Glutathionylspermidine amidase / glutathionylspermidine synthetase n=1 Tax=Aliarcobacter skirrowii CCUG 10374 TaxID=1032239 RepID=A0AAD0SN05_9BACT|nr:glutathionylspermidine synthase family protein [Aliarcobacter skirrowii]AXX85141.1 glutathionylspermidine amidase / glutathionylspermidine synthetase [Aliarcobacter skirrowii CCUG 10374]KAB0620702.1 glutathionylspermidine synthase family protein [Aliarcobacter skirrowii CCUG 10374]RXI25951.1 glutathionylspermidine synthase [Aliarcobacter skirrowii CCUG 10374]SUU96333.1 Bifunctional glutathionylspermidine synthetase/amidase [Aliarcobacter skirrowii]